MAEAHQRYVNNVRWDTLIPGSRAARANIEFGKQYGEWLPGTPESVSGLPAPIPLHDEL